jgi:hypothetical protein
VGQIQQGFGWCFVYSSAIPIFIHFFWQAWPCVCLFCNDLVVFPPSFPFSVLVLQKKRFTTLSLIRWGDEAPTRGRPAVAPLW